MTDENSKKEKSEKKKQEFYWPTELEKEVDYAVVQYAIENGITD